MKRCSCLATSVPSAPRAEPENVRTVSRFPPVRAHAATNNIASTQLRRQGFTRLPGTNRGKPPTVAKLHGKDQQRLSTLAQHHTRQNELHRQIRNVPQL